MDCGTKIKATVSWCWCSWIRTCDYGSYCSHEDAAAGRISWFDPGAEAVSRSLSYILQDVSGSVWTTAEEAEKSLHRAQWAAAKFTCVLFDYFHADVCSVQVCALSCERTCCQIKWPDWSDCLLGSKKLSWVWKCCEFVQWNYTVVVKDYIVRPFEKAFRYMIYQFTHGGRWYYRQRTSHAHMKV